MSLNPPIPVPICLNIGIHSTGAPAIKEGLPSSHDHLTGLTEQQKMSLVFYVRFWEHEKPL